MEQILKIIREHLPAPGTRLGEYVFLPPDGLWTGEADGLPFAAVAEDRWANGGGMFLLVREDGPVYLSDFENYGQLDYCAAGFPEFMEIMYLLLETRSVTPSPDVWDDEGLARCAEAERVLREKIRKIDPAAIEDENGFWSIWLEELGSGM